MGPSMDQAMAYPVRAVWGDGLRAFAGLAAAAIVLSLSAAAWAQGIAALAAAGFGWLGLSALDRHLARINIDTDGIHKRGLISVRIRWADLGSLRLAYYTTRRDRENGWFRLQLAAGDTRLALYSGLTGFEDVARHAVRAAGNRGLALDGPTVDNLNAIGIKYIGCATEPAT